MLYNKTVTKNNTLCVYFRRDVASLRSANQWDDLRL